MLKIFLIILTAGVLQCSCVTTSPPISDDSQIIHIVIIWLHEPENEDHINKVIKATQSLKEIPEVQETRVGKKILSERTIVDDSFDVGIVLVFKNRDALDTYLIHPIHIEAVKSVLRPLASKILVYDFEDGR